MTEGHGRPSKIRPIKPAFGAGAKSFRPRLQDGKCTFPALLSLAPEDLWMADALVVFQGYTGRRAMGLQPHGGRLSCRDHAAAQHALFFELSDHSASFLGKCRCSNSMWCRPYRSSPRAHATPWRVIMWPTVSRRSRSLFCSNVSQLEHYPRAPYVLLFSFQLRFFVDPK